MCNLYTRRIVYMKQTRQYIALLLMLLLPFTGTAQNSNQSNIDARKRAVDYFHLEAVSLQEQERYDEAYEMLEYCLQLDPASATTKYLLTVYYTVLGKDSIACSLLEEIVKENPDNKDYNDALVNQYAKQGNWKAAIAVYERIVDTADSKEEIYKALYTLYYNDDNYERALEMLDRIESIEGKSRELTTRELQILMQLGRHEELIAIIGQEIAENPDDFRFKVLLGDVHGMMGEFRLAEEIYLKVLEEMPGEVLAQSALAELYAMQENDEAFSRTMETLIKNDRLQTQERVRYLVDYVLYKETTDSAYIHEFYKELLQLPFDKLELHQSYADYLEYKHADKSLLGPVYEKIVELDAENISAIIKLLQYAIDDEDEDAVFKYANEALMFLPQHLELHFYKGLSLYMLGNKKKSIEVYLEGLEKRDAETEPAVVASVFTILGDTYHELEMKKEAYTAYDSALVYDPYKLDVLNNYSYYLSLDGKELQKALEMSHKTITAEPESQTYLDTYAWILFKLKRYQEAKAYAEKIISLEEEISAVVLHHIGDIFAKCGNIEGAVTYWQKALDAGDEESDLLKKKIKKRRYYNGSKH